MTPTTTDETVTGLRSRGSRLVHQPALDGIRGLAVIGVLLFHGEHLLGGYLGVDAFFVLSGFLITSLLLAEASARGSISLGHFWARRARRLLPALGCVLAAVALYAMFVAGADELAAIRSDALWTLGYAANWRQVFVGVDYFALYHGGAALSHVNSPLNHTWSLAIEEQFYVLWPLIVLALVRGRAAAASARRVLLTSLALAVASITVAQLLYDPVDTSRVYYGTDTRIASILFGAALAAWIALRGPVHGTRARRSLEGAALLSIVGLVIAWSRLSGSSATLYRGGLVACAIGVAIVIAAATHPERGVVARALSFQPLRAVGLVSYGLYLWHVPVYVYLNSSRAHLSGWWLLVVRLAVTGLVSFLSYRLVERPIRYGAGSTRLMRRITPAVAIALVMAMLVSTAAVARSEPKGGVLLVGDSVAHSLFPGLIEARMRVNEAWVPGCRLLTGEIRVNMPYKGNCRWRDEWHAQVTRLRPAVVVMVIGAWDLFDLRPPGSRTFLRPGDPGWTRYYLHQLGAALRVLQRQGAKVVIPTLPCEGSVSGVPGFDEHSAGNVNRVRIANGVLAKFLASHRDVENPDLFSLLCPKGKYQLGVDTVPIMRGDGVHFTSQGAVYVANWLLPFVTAAAPNAHLTLGKPAHLAIVYGDAPAYESRSEITEQFAGQNRWRLVNHSSPLNAVCDMLPQLRSDLATLHPFTVVIQNSGNSRTPCMTDVTGQQLKVGSAAYFAKYRADLHAFLRAATAEGARVIVLTAPPAANVLGEALRSRLEALARVEARLFSGVSITNATRDALGGATFAQTLPCIHHDIGFNACQRARIAVRAPDHVLFCPYGYASMAALAYGCPSYSSGAWRYAVAIHDAIVGPERKGSR